MVKKYKIYTIVILGFLLILYAVIRHFQMVDSFELINTNHPKTIYLIWRNMMPVAGNDATHAGFGDKIRGAIALYQYIIYRIYKWIFYSRRWKCIFNVFTRWHYMDRLI